MKYSIVFSADRQKEGLKKAQDYIDSECVRLMTPLVPVGLPKYDNSGKLRDSAVIVRPGRIEYTAPFARRDYYNKKVDHRRGGNPKARRMWFEPMKKQHAPQILRGAAAIAGGVAK